jgi:hypothetical protein
MEAPMRDKLAEAIRDAAEKQGIGLTDMLPNLAADAALAWLREYLGSDEVIERAARAMAAEINFTFDAFDERTQSKYLRQSRAALSSIMEQSDGR